MKRNDARRQLFMSVAAQEDNLGDVAIRKVAAHWLSETQAQLVVFTGRMSSSYVDALDLPADVPRMSSRSHFLARMLRSCLTRPTVIVFAPGPTGVGPGPRLVLRSLTNRLLVAVARLSGGGTISLGRAFRGNDGFALGIERSIANASLIHTVRDPISAALLGGGTKTEPDLAFALPAITDATSAEDSVGLSVRDAEQYSDDFLASVFSEIRAVGLNPVLITQVQRDSAAHEALAERHGLRHIAWPDGTSHSDQWALVRDEYSRCKFVVSNRLHALLFGVAEGAVPISLGPSEKAPSTLNFLVDSLTLHPDDHVAATTIFKDHGIRAQRLRIQADGARARLWSVRDSVRASLTAI